MRKFTKEITALFASAAIGASACSGTVSASEQPVLPDEPAACSEDYPPFAGGVWGIDQPDSDDLLQTADEPIPADAYPDAADIPPLGGALAPADGDLNGDFILDETDMDLFQKWLLHPSDSDIPSEYDLISHNDFNYDGILNAVDLTMMKQHAMAYQKTDQIHTEKGITVFSPANSKTAVKNYLYQIYGSELRVDYPIACFNVTPLAVTQQYGFRIFYDDNRMPYGFHCYALEYEGKTYRLDFDLKYTMLSSFAVADLNQDGKIEIYYTVFRYTDKDNKLRPDQKIAYFDTATLTVHQFDYKGDDYGNPLSQENPLLTLQNGSLEIVQTTTELETTTTVRTYGRICEIGQLSADDGEIGITYYPQYDEMYHDVKELDD
ncbi:MAG TPA: hypothetical protein DCG49_03800 [Ruminococcus sp.]|nr:hypothetical protein [Ruminococcus sp.]